MQKISVEQGNRGDKAEHDEQFHAQHAMREHKVYSGEQDRKPEWEFRRRFDFRRMDVAEAMTFGDRSSKDHEFSIVATESQSAVEGNHTHNEGEASENPGENVVWIRKRK